MNFQVIVDPSENSSIASVLNASQQAVKMPDEVREQNQKKRNLRKEAKIFEASKPFSKTLDEKALFGFLIEIVAKAGNLLTCVGALGRPSESMRVIEMSLNKTDIMLDKSKMLIMKLDKTFVIVPFTMTKIEIRMRNVIINMRPKFEAIQRFTQVFLDLYAE